MLQENQPQCHLDVVIVRRKHDGSAVARCRVLMRDGTWHSVVVQEWPSGRPDEAQLRLLVAGVCEELETLLLGTVGVQGSLVG